MDDLTDTRHISRLEIVDTGRRRRWSAADKLRIVEKSFSAPRLASATAQQWQDFRGDFLDAFSGRSPRMAQIEGHIIDADLPSGKMLDQLITTETVIEKDRRGV